MKIKNLILALVVIVASTITVNAQSTIVDIAVGSKDHSTLVAAVKAADLVATLQSAGPFTVFAPVNAAFGKLPAGTVEYLLKPENKATLAKILNYLLVFNSLWCNITQSFLTVFFVIRVVTFKRINFRVAFKS